MKERGKGVGPNGALVLLFLSVTLNLLDRSVINILAQDIKIDLQITDAQLGLLTGTAFGIFYSILAIPIGRIADRVNRVKLIAVIMTLWSVCTVLCGAAANYAQLFVMRMFVGIGEAGGQPAATALVPELFPAHRRTTALSFLLLGVPIGSVLGLLVGGLAGAAWGWRVAFVVAGAPGVLLALVIFLTMRDPRQHPPESASVSLGGSLRRLLSQPLYLRITVALTFSTFLAAASGAWLPALFIRVHGMSTGEIGFYAATATALGGGLGTVGAGFICDRLRGRATLIESRFLLVLFAFSVPAVLVTVLMPDRWIALSGMVVFYACAFAWLGPTMRLIHMIVEVDQRALAVAVGISIANVLSLIIGMPIIGFISDAFAPDYGPLSLGIALAITLSVASLVIIAVHWSVLRSKAQFLAVKTDG